MAGTLANGTSLTVKRAGSEAEDTVIRNRTTVSAPETSYPPVDVSDLDSDDVAGGAESIPGSAEFSEVNVTTNVTDANKSQIQKIESIAAAHETRTFERTDSTGTLTIIGYISKHGFGEATRGGLIQYSFSIQPTEAPVFTPASAGE